MLILYTFSQFLTSIFAGPISLWDAPYGCASFIKQTSDIAADKLMRLRSNRLLYGAPPPYNGTGRPRIHGDKFKLNDSSTWWTPDQTIEVNDTKIGRLSIRVWCHLHFQQSKDHSMNLIQIQRLDEFGVPKNKALWLAWVGLKMPCFIAFGLGKRGGIGSRYPDQPTNKSGGFNPSSFSFFRLVILILAALLPTICH
jgi:hypothetical protein